jgi:hypothetical protein
MADNIDVTPGTGKTVLADEVTDGVMGTGIAQMVKIMDGTLGGTDKAVVSAAGALKVDGSGVTQPVSDAGGSLTVDGTVSITANSAVNVAQVGGTNTATNSGNVSAGVQRVVIATDQPQLTNKLLVTPDANSAVNISQMNGTTVTMGNGASGTGVQRVTIASDSTGVIAVTDNGSSLTVDNGGTFAVQATGGSTFNAAVPSTGLAIGFSDGTNLVRPRATSAAIADDTTPPTSTIPLANNFNMVFDGSTWDRQPGNSTNGTFTDTKALAGTAIAVNTGNASAGTQRVVLATDQPTVTITPTTGIVTCTTSFTRPSDTTAYAVGDAISDSTSAPTSGGFTFTSAASGTGKSGIITDLIVTSSAAGALNGEIQIFDTAVTNINDNSAYAISDSEVQTLIGSIPFTLIATGNNASCTVSGVGLGFTTVGNANLRFLVRVMAAYTPVSAEVFTFRLKVLQRN